MLFHFYVFFFFKQKTAYEMRISDWSSDVCSSDLKRKARQAGPSIASVCRAQPAGGGACCSGAATVPTSSSPSSSSSDASTRSIACRLPSAGRRIRVTPGVLRPTCAILEGHCPHGGLPPGHNTQGRRIVKVKD